MWHSADVVCGSHCDTMQTYGNSGHVFLDINRANVTLCRHQCGQHLWLSADINVVSVCVTICRIQCGKSMSLFTEIKDVRLCNSFILYKFSHLVKYLQKFMWSLHVTCCRLQLGQAARLTADSKMWPAWVTSPLMLLPAAIIVLLLPSDWSLGLAF